METQIIKISKIWLSICHICQKWSKLATLIPLVFRWPLAAFKIKRPPNEGYCFPICSSEASFDFLSEQKLCWLSEAFVFNNQRVLAGTCHRGFKMVKGTVVQNWISSSFQSPDLQFWFKINLPIVLLLKLAVWIWDTLLQFSK